MPDKRLQRHIREAVSRGLLPATVPRKTWGGFGTDSPCAVCGLLITPEQLETEFEDGGRRSYRLHIHCFATWEAIARSIGTNPGLPLSLNDGYDFRDEQSPLGGPR
jgi:hypothetical protein